MKPKTALSLILSCLLLAACTGQTPPPQVLKAHADIPASLRTCAARPAAPCPAPAADNKPAEPCTEKDRLRWEAMIFNWGSDCESKLRALSGYISEAFPPAQPAQKSP